MSEDELKKQIEDKFSQIQELIKMYPQAALSGSGTQTFRLVEANEFLRNIQIILEGI